jgi:hypothetical protein
LGQGLFDSLALIGEKIAWRGCDSCVPTLGAKLGCHPGAALIFKGNYHEITNSSSTSHAFGRRWQYQKWNCAIWWHCMHALSIGMQRIIRYSGTTLQCRL